MRRLIQNISEWKAENLLSVLGATASGKTQVVIDHVRSSYSDHKHPLLVSLDSVAVYKKLDIGSAKVMGKDRSDFDWCGLDLADVDQKLTAADFARLVKPLIQNAQKNKRPVILVGGSHFYERMLLEGPSAGVASDPEFIKEISKLENQVLHQRLLEKDARWASKIHVNDRYRLERFSDLVLRQGLDFETLTKSGADFPLGNIDTLIMGSDKAPDDDLFLARIYKMFDAGWIEEVKDLLKTYSEDSPGFQTVGYRELIAGLGQGLDRAQLGQAILISHRQVAKKQRTWLRSLKN
ncbi:MAG: tRNA (adenosine(37)-N6)-dimethylallyltransferase MiaA [Proteobacteria bacterium]|nr:tRNA (adenosine(37)-N6)-dimethylallyltransferase MiaA [Pseudomonadota bacterium]